MKKESCVIWMQTVSLYTEKQTIYLKKLQKDVESRFNTSSYRLDRPLLKGEN